MDGIYLNHSIFPFLLPLSVEKLESSTVGSHPNTQPLFPPSWTMFHATCLVLGQLPPASPCVVSFGSFLSAACLGAHSPSVLLLNLEDLLVRPEELPGLSSLPVFEHLDPLTCLSSVVPQLLPAACLACSCSGLVVCWGWPLVNTNAGCRKAANQQCQKQ